MDEELGSRSLISKDGLDLGLVRRLGHVDGQPMSELVGQYLILGTGDHLHSGNVPRDRDVLVTDAALKDGVLALGDFDVFQRLRELKLFSAQRSSPRTCSDGDTAKNNDNEDDAADDDDDYDTDNNNNRNSSSNDNNTIQQYTTI